MCVTMSPGFSSARIAGSGETVWPTCSITGRPKGSTAARARRTASRSFLPTTVSVRRAFTPTITSRCRSIALRAASTSALAMSISSVPDAEADLRQVQQDAHAVGRRLGDRDDLVDLVGALRAGIDQRRHALRQHDARHVGRARVRVHVDQSGHDQLAGGVDGLLRALRSDADADCGDAPVRDRHVGDAIEAARRVDYPPAAYQHVVRRRIGLPCCSRAHTHPTRWF